MMLIIKVHYNRHKSLVIRNTLWSSKYWCQKINISKSIIENYFLMNYLLKSEYNWDSSEEA